jgi:Tfp pilus assembly protein PilF
VNLGSALIEKDQPEQAIEQYLRAIAIDPNDAAAHCGLSLARQHKWKRDEVQRSLEAPWADLEPPRGLELWAKVHTPMWGEDLLRAAIQDARRAIELDPNFAQAHNRLGVALWDKGVAYGNKGQCDEALTEYRRAIELDDNDARSHNNLGAALRDRGQIDKAIQEFRRAIELDPKCAAFHNNLGLALHERGQIKEAIQKFRLAVELDPKDSWSHYHLGIYLNDKGELTAALQEDYCRALGLDPKFTQARVALAKVFLYRGQFAESEKAFYGIGPNWFRQTSDLVILDEKLSAVLQGKQKPADATECIALAQLCQAPPRKQFAASYRLYVQAFANQLGAELAGDMKAQHRYHAACAAALGGCCQGNDAFALDEEQRARLRQQAMVWLRADLAHWTKQAASDEPADRNLWRSALNRWLYDTDLTCVRDKAALEKLPQEEREAWQDLWADVANLLTKAEVKTK